MRHVSGTSMIKYAKETFPICLSNTVGTYFYYIILYHHRRSNAYRMFAKIYKPTRQRSVHIYTSADNRSYSSLYIFSVSQYTSNVPIINIGPCSFLVVQFMCWTSLFSNYIMSTKIYFFL